MGMKYTFQELNIPLQTRFKKQHKRQYINTGLDTETYKGYTRLITDDKGRYVLVESIEDILTFMTHSRFRNNWNWFYNIKFDFESIIKYLDIDDLYELYNTGKLTYSHWKIKYLDKKYLSITHENHTHSFYDLNNFLESSLNQAASLYLNDSKMGNVDAARLNTDINYWNENLDIIIYYCIKDSKLTKQLADYFWQLMKNTLDFLPKSPFSKGALSQEYFLYNCFIPTINGIDRHILEAAYNSYSGGRFELIQRGFFDSIYTYDIKSAYPFQMSKLIDYNLGTWNKTKKFVEDAYSGFYKCKISFFHPVFSPFMQRLDNLNTYPIGTFTQWLTQNELAFILKNFNDVEIKVLEGYYFIENYEKFPFKEEILRLYDLKENAPNKEIRQVYKIVLNSLYGKFIQTIGQKVGKIFNPIYASEITANTRLMLLEAAIKQPDKIIGFSTDSIHSQVSLNLDIGKELGKWELDFKGKGVIIMSDIYSLWDNELNKDKAKKSKFRGFRISKLDKDLYDILNSLDMNTEYNYSIFRPTHLGEVLTHTKRHTIEDLNIWKQDNRTININGDTKRIWEKSFLHGKDVFLEKHTSIPILL